MPFFLFLQNNSGGGYTRTDKLDAGTVIEAHTAAEANGRAEALGIYFDGVSLGLDCDCCGDRWSPVGETEALTLDALDSEYDWVTSKIVHYLDGRVERRTVTA